MRLLYRPKSLDRTIRGLKYRLNLRDERIAHQTATTSEQVALLEREFSAQQEALLGSQSSKYAETLTDWDERTETIWAQAEASVLKNLVDEQQNKRAQKKKTKAALETALAEYETNRQAILKENAIQKSKPPKVFQATRLDLDTRLQEVVQYQTQAEELMAKRSVSAPTSHPNETRAFKLATIDQVQSELADRKNRAEAALQAFQKNPKAKLTEGWAVALWSILVAAAAAGICFATYSQSIVILTICGIVAATVTSMVVMLIMRPIVGRLARSSFPQIVSEVTAARLAAKDGLAIAEEKCRDELTAIKDHFAELLSKSESEYKAKVDSIKKRGEESTHSIVRKARSGRLKNAATKKQQLGQVSTDEASQLSQLKNSQDDEVAQVKRAYDAKTAGIVGELRASVEFLSGRFDSGVEWSNSSFTEVANLVRESFPAWSNPAFGQSPLKRINPAAVVPLGNIKIDIPSTGQDSTSKSAGFQGELPLLFHWIDHGYLVANFDSSTERAAVDMVKEFIFRALTSLPAGQLQMTIIDPDGLGRDYASLMTLADADPTIVNHRVWTQSSHITEQLTRLSHHTEDVIQQSLRDRFRDIRGYNQEAGAMREPYRLVVWSRFPSGLDEQSWRQLSSLLSSGGRCGVAVLLLREADAPVPGNVNLGRLEQGGLHLDFVGSKPEQNVPRLSQEPWSEFEIALADPPDDQQQMKLAEICATEALVASRIEVPFASIAPPDTELYQGSTGDTLSVPIGQAGVGRIHHLRLGLGTAQHVLIAGKTGSGKSSLLHTLITSAAMKFSPEELRMVLLDFKKGVEFQVYSQLELPHADIIGIESQREFGLSTFEYLDKVMQRRGELFREAGVQDIPGWRAKFPNRPMPRILTVVDEFQELFVEDDKLGQQAAMLLDRIVRQGRSFGMHIVLASQTLGGAYSLPRTTLAQMAVRVALQCEGSDAMLILAEDNLAAERLRHAGQAVYNDTGGRIEGNHPFQVAYITQAVQTDFLNRLPTQHFRRDESNQFLDRQVVFEGHKQAVWDSQTADRFVMQKTETREQQVVGFLGDSVSIEPAVSVGFAPAAGRNVLLIGNEDRLAADTIATLIGSLHRQCNATVKSVMTSSNTDVEGAVGDLSASTEVQRWTLLNGAKADDTYALQLPILIAAIDATAVVADPRSFETSLERIYQCVKQRTLEDKPNNPAKFLIISQLARFRELRKSDEFSFGNDEDASIKPDAMFAEIVRDGPAVGVYTIVWADNYNTVSRWFPRQSLHDFESRILMQMSANDSNHLIDSPLANRLGPHIMLLYDESSGKVQKFRPYRLVEFDDLVAWANA